MGSDAVAWTWRYESADGSTVEPTEAPASEPFPSQGDAESWLGESWQELLHAGVAQVSLFDGGRQVYGPMSLSPE
jgi:hypothetical protein